MVAVRPHMGVFGLYVGLTASGYNLAKVSPQSPVGLVLRAIHTAEWPKSVRAYFGNARTRSGGINPYWPRAAMLLEACFYLEQGRGFRPPDELRLLRAIADFPVPAVEKGSTTAAWVREYPEAFAAVIGTEIFPVLWTSYLGAVEPHLHPWEEAASKALDSLTGMAGIPGESLPDLVIIPNLLQAPEIADFVRRPDAVHMVLAEPRMSSMVHELLHDVLGPVFRSNRQEIVGQRRLLRPVLGTMTRMQYAWGDDEQSWMRVFEENMMRAAGIWMENERRSDEGDRQAAAQAKQGFIYVPPMLRCLREKWVGPENAPRFISDCLSACARSIS